MEHINSLIEEEAKILYKNKQTINDEKDWIKRKMHGIEKKKAVLLIAECENKVVGNAHIYLEKERRDHIGGFAIGIRQGFRGIGLGKKLMAETIKLAKMKLKPKPKMLQLNVYINNKPAISLYKKMGFKNVM